MFLLSIKTKLNQAIERINYLKQQRPAVHILNAITQKNFKLQRDIAYADDMRHRLDIYAPLEQAGQTPVLKPVILFVHGGTWQRGDKNQYLFAGESFSQAGYVVAVMNYRLAPRHKYPDYVQDVALAIKWLSQHIQDYSGDPNQLVLIGHSAGAFNIVSAINNEKWLSEVDVPVSVIKAVIGLAGPYSFSIPEHPDTIPAFEENTNSADVMADRYIRPDAPPHLLMIASDDELVTADNTFKLAKALRDKKVPVQIEVVKGASHISIMSSVATRLAWHKPTRQLILGYLNSVLGKS